MNDVSNQPEHIKRIRSELIKAGATIYGLLKAESRYLPHIIHPDEHIQAIVYGQHISSSAMLIATDQRIIYLDKKPIALFMDEVTYDVVSGIELDVHTLFASVTLHTAVLNYQIKFANIRCADRFTSFIEEQRVKRSFEEIHNYKPNKESLSPKQVVDALKRNLSGYYWVPKVEDKEREYHRNGTV
jgi:Bacterial PH domain